MAKKSGVRASKPEFVKGSALRDAPRVTALRKNVRRLIRISGPAAKRGRRKAARDLSERIDQYEALLTEMGIQEWQCEEAEEEREVKLERAVTTYYQTADALTDALMMTAGYHRHRGTWRTTLRGRPRLRGGT